MITRTTALAAAMAVAASALFALPAAAAPTPTPGAPSTPAASTPTTPARPSASPTKSTAPQGGWPKATFKGRTATVSNLAPGWRVSLTATNLKTKKTYTFTAVAKSTSVVVELTGVPDGVYEIWIDAGDLPANESLYNNVVIKSDRAPAGERKGGLSKTGV